MNIKHITEGDFLRKYGSDKACLTELLDYRKSEDGLCFNSMCKGTIKDYKYMEKRNRKAFLCPKCLHHYYPMTDSIFCNSHVSTKDWFHIIFKMLYSRNGISAHEIKQTMGYSYRTAHKIIHAIRDQMSKSVQFYFKTEQLEIDESFIRTGNKGMNQNTYLGTGRGNKKHTMVLAIVARGGNVRLFVIPNAESGTLTNIIEECVDRDCTIYTDKWKGYSNLKKLGYKHETVNHSYEFVNGSASTNNCESIFSNLKRIIKGTHRNVNHRKLQAYLDEYAFRYSYRNHDDYGFKVFLNSFSSLSANYGLKNAA